MEIHKSSRINLFIQSLLVIAIFLYIFIAIILSFTPPIARDALIHHLAIPKLWLLNGGFYETKWAEFSYYPMNIDLLYLIPLFFHNDIIPNFIHMGFGIGTAWLIYRYLNTRLNRVSGLLGVLVFVSTPIVFRLSTIAYVDLGLVFFTTASILAFFKWRDLGYKGYKWILISSVAMGLALGSKYNALIAWFFLSLSIVFFYSRDTEKQWKAVGYGSLFFLVSLAVFSPWLIKNLILTGNPLFPLFKSVFNPTLNNISPFTGLPTVMHADAEMGIFKMREMLYKENFWETLLIPLRFFFQGQDHSDRYFEGVLNPILILMVPFAFMTRTLQKEKMFFMLFSVFFLLTAFFLEQPRVRYVLPAIPLLSILAVIGITNIFAWIDGKTGRVRKLLACVTVLFLFVLGAKSVIYVNQYFQSLKPMNYILGKETRGDYLKRHLPFYGAMSFINQHTPLNARVRMFLLAGRGYYLDRLYEEDASFGMDVIFGFVINSKEDLSFQRYIESLRCTHFLVRKDMFLKYLKDNFPPATINRVYGQLHRTTETLYDAKGYAVYRLIAMQ